MIQDRSQQTEAAPAIAVLADMQLEEVAAGMDKLNGSGNDNSNDNDNGRGRGRGDGRGRGRGRGR